MAIIANVTNNSVGPEVVLSDINDKLSEVQLPPRSRGQVQFADEQSFDAAVEASNKTPKVIFITKADK